MNTQIREIENLKDAFVKLDTDSERSAFVAKIKLDFDNKTESEQETFLEAFELSAKEACSRADSVIQYLEIKMKLADILEIVSMDYIAEHYFQQTGDWFLQRLNGYPEKGIPLTFTAAEIKKLSIALEDISKRLSEAARSIA